MKQFGMINVFNVFFLIFDLIKKNAVKIVIFWNSLKEHFSIFIYFNMQIIPVMTLNIVKKKTII